MTWFELKGDARLGRCATEGCGGQPAFCMEAGGVGSNYCSGCHENLCGSIDTPENIANAIVNAYRHDGRGEIYLVARIADAIRAATTERDEEVRGLGLKLDAARVALEHVTLKNLRLEGALSDAQKRLTSIRQLSE